MWRLAAGDVSGRLLLFDLATAAHPRQRQVSDDAIKALAFAPHDPHLVVGTSQGSILLVEANSGEQLQIRNGSGKSCLSLAHSATGAHVAAGFQCGTLRLLRPRLDYELHSWNFSADIIALVFAPDSQCLVAAANSTLHVVDPWSGIELHTCSLDGFIFALAYVPNEDVDSAACIDAATPGTSVWSPTNLDGNELTVQRVEHEVVEVAATISAEEAMQTQDELWASGVEALIAGASMAPAPPSSGEPRLLLLSFCRFTIELERALLASPPAIAAAARGVPTKPIWARGAKVFEAIDEECLLAKLPDRSKSLRPWHVVVRSEEEAALLESLGSLPESARRLKHGVGRLPLGGTSDDRSLEAAGDEERRVPEVEVSRTFLHLHMMQTPALRARGDERPQVSRHLFDLIGRKLAQVFGSSLRYFGRMAGEVDHCQGKLPSAFDGR
eukprot:CAMPEP_0115706796 /NCGR_PEP_ID=MMETSP0272-20121206/70996_1 /TAXON_ID=71861 /ORGANISM="Scrippsiella trochoidea, Strain CCMP3099" /LENGTH=441 /DNA_ID=CAMNT_0003148097 /DNA_START=87 /DNA_END=1411 /DNA_ORIENTATION=+